MDMHTAFSALDRINLAKHIYCEPGRKWVDIHAYLTAIEMHQNLFTETALRASKGNHANDLELVKFMVERLCGYCYPVEHFAQVLSDLGFGEAVKFILIKCPEIDISKTPVATLNPDKFDPYQTIGDASREKKDDMQVEPTYCTMEQFALFKNHMENYCLSMSRAHEELAEDCKQRFASLHKFVQEQVDLVAIRSNEETKKEMSKMLIHVNVQAEQIFKRINALGSSPPSIPNVGKPSATNGKDSTQPKIVYMKDMPLYYMTEPIAREVAASWDWDNLGLYFSEQDDSLPNITRCDLEAEFGYLPPIRLVERLLAKLSKAGAKVHHLTHALKQIGLGYLAEQITQKFNI